MSARDNLIPLKGRHWIRLAVEFFQEPELLERLAISKGREVDAGELVGECASGFVVVRSAL
jgi:hypothetical protein